MSTIKKQALRRMNELCNACLIFMFTELNPTLFLYYYNHLIAERKASKSVHIETSPFLANET